MISITNEREINHNSVDDISMEMQNFHGGPPIGDELLPPLARRSEDDGDKASESGVLKDHNPSRIPIHYKVDISQSSGVASGDAEAKEVTLNDGVRIPHGLVQNWMEGFDIGDMVWGKVKSHPWWPGQVFNEAFTSPTVQSSKKEGHILVAFFGDNSYGWFPPTELITFDPHFTEKSKQTTKISFMKAIEEAVEETSRRAALGLTCFCLNKFNFLPTLVPGYFHVDVPGFEPGGVYSLKQINDARDGFEPKSVLSFLKQAALNPMMSESPDLDRIKCMATLLAYRRAAFEEFDETYAQAFGVEPLRPPPNNYAMPDQIGWFAPGATLSGQLVIPESQRPKRVSKQLLATTRAAKKNKYMLKRRVETGGASSEPSLSNLQFPYCPGYYTAPDLLHLHHNVGTGEPVSSNGHRYVVLYQKPSRVLERPSRVTDVNEQKPLIILDDSDAEAPELEPQQLEVSAAVDSVVTRLSASDDSKSSMM